MSLAKEDVCPLCGGVTKKSGYHPATRYGEALVYYHCGPCDITYHLPARPLAPAEREKSYQKTREYFNQVRSRAGR